MKKLSQLPQELQNAYVAQLQQVQSCELCGGNHTNGQCAMPSTSQEEVNFNVFEAVQESTDEETSLKAINEVLSVTSKPCKLLSCLESAQIVSPQSE